MQMVTVPCGWDDKIGMPIVTCPFCGAHYPDRMCEHSMGLRTEDKMDFVRFNADGDHGEDL